MHKLCPKVTEEAGTSRKTQTTTRLFMGGLRPSLTYNWMPVLCLMS